MGIARHHRTLSCDVGVVSIHRRTAKIFFAKCLPTANPRKFCPAKISRHTVQQRKYLLSCKTRQIYVYQLCKFVFYLINTQQDGWSALMAASRNGNLSAVGELLNAGAQPNLEDEVNIQVKYTGNVT